MTVRWTSVVAVASGWCASQSRLPPCHLMTVHIWQYANILGCLHILRVRSACADQWQVRHVVTGQAQGAIEA